jgi:hypothetical protein
MYNFSSIFLAIEIKKTSGAGLTSWFFYFWALKYTSWWYLQLGWDWELLCLAPSPLKKQAYDHDEENYEHNENFWGYQLLF